MVGNRPGSPGGPERCGGLARAAGFTAPCTPQSRNGNASVRAQLWRRAAEALAVLVAALALAAPVRAQDTVIWETTMTVGSVDVAVGSSTVTTTGFSTDPATGQLAAATFEAEKHSDAGTTRTYTVTELSHQTVTAANGTLQSSTLRFVYEPVAVAERLFLDGLTLVLANRVGTMPSLTYRLSSANENQSQLAWNLANAPAGQLPGGQGDGDTLKVQLVKAAPLTAELELAGEDEGPGGRVEYLVDLKLSERIWIPSEDMRDDAFTVTNGTVARAQRHTRLFRHVDGVRRKVSRHWRLTVQSDNTTSAATVLSLPDNRRCNVSGALCTRSLGRLEDGPAITLGEGENTMKATLSVADATAAEGSYLTFTVTATRPLKRNIFAGVQILREEGTATSNVDYEDWGSGTVQMVAGDTTMSFRVFAKTDAVTDDGETVRVRLFGAWVIDGLDYDTGDYIKARRKIRITDSKATGTITDVSSSSSSSGGFGGQAVFGARPSGLSGDGAPARLWWAPADGRPGDASPVPVADLAALGRPVPLERLDLSDNGLAELDGIEAHAGLRALDLSGNRVADLWPLAGLRALERLDLSGNRVADLSPLAGLAALRVLVLDGNAASDLGPLTHLAALEELSLAGNAVRDVGPLQDLPRLRRLDLRGTPVSDLSPLGDVLSLEWLGLPGGAAADTMALRTGLRVVRPETTGAARR